jgi:hypothetical protein
MHWKAVEPELALVVACLRWPSDAAARTQIAACLSPTLDWDRFIFWAKRHRVVSLVFETLRQTENLALPAGVVDSLRQASQRQARISLQQVAETVLLTRLLAEAGIGVVVLKGPALSQLAFGQPALRDSRDIDLLIEPVQVPRVDAILATQTYQRIKPVGKLSARLSSAYRQWTHEIVYRSASRGSLVEIKHRLHPTQALLALDIERLTAHPRIVHLSGHGVPVLPDVELFLYLCTHGSRHCWFRLKWLADIGALLSGMSGDLLDKITERAAFLGVERSLREALLLAHHLLAAPVPETLLANARADTAVRHRVALVQQSIATFGTENDLTSLRFMTRLDIAEYTIRPEWSYRLAVLQRHVLARLYGVWRMLAVKRIQHFRRKTVSG